MADEKAREEWGKVKPLAGGLWILAWGIFAAVCGIILLIRRPFDWGSYGIMWVGMGMIYLGGRAIRDGRRQLKELGENNPLRKYDCSHLRSK